MKSLTEKQPFKDTDCRITWDVIPLPDEHFPNVENSLHRVGPDGLGMGLIDKLTLLRNGVPVEYNPNSIIYNVCLARLRQLETEQQNTKVVK